MKISNLSGKKICVIAPSNSGSILSEEVKAIASNRLQEMNFQVIFSKNCLLEAKDNVVPARLRASDLNEAFKNKDVAIILSAIGGFNSNEILRLIDYDLIKKNEKIICGYSDMTAVLNAIYTKTKKICFLGPHYSSFGEKEGFEFTKDHFIQTITQSSEVEVLPSRKWSDDSWYRCQHPRTFYENEGYWVIQEGKAEGRIIGGNLFTFKNLAGTEFFPGFNEDTILFIEDDKLADKNQIRTNLVSLSLINNFEKYIKGLVIGRFQIKSEISKEDIREIVDNIPSIKNIPVIANVDFGHTTPMITIPIGGKARIETLGSSLVKLFIQY